ncbi:MAG: S46 family peptidase [Gemmatimonadetes bacterium]|nr:S46 family peptidase [Gemmatimonadota bacterium]MDA1103139.1 S46 family peptidase [Gemmatimonadota bacterium]
MKSIGSAGFRFSASLTGALLAAACGGAPAPARPASPVPAPAVAPPVAEAPVPVVPVAPVEPRPFVYGVDLDTVQAGRFDQGKMWTFEFPPLDYLEETYGFRPDAAWFEKARLGALRIPSCSASFVSPNGLVMTNHHCAREFVSQVSGEGEALLDGGLVAKDLADERAVEDFEADQLVAIVDVTAEVNAALDALSAAERPDARESLLEEIEARVLLEHGGEESAHVVEMISLYNGGRTSAYVFRRYTHAKLVMAPELQIGFFGGDPDNFTYPRYNLDFSFFRIYDDDGQPLKSDHYFPFDADGLRDGDPIFIVGNPGSTSRLQTVAELEFRRDVSDRAIIDLLRSRMAVLDGYIEANPVEAEERDLRNSYFSLANSLKAYGGQVGGLEDPIIIARRQDTERDFQAAIDGDAALAERYGSLIQEMADLQDQKATQAPGFGAFLAMTSSDLESATLHRALIAYQILSAQQGGAPAEAIDPLMEELLGVPDQAPDLDRAFIEARFNDFVSFFGMTSPLASAVLRGQSVEARAAAVVSSSQLQDSATAVAAIESGALTMGDAALEIVRAYLPSFIGFQQVVAGVFPQEEAIAAELGRARFEIYGTDVPPDATFSLRIADGVVGGYEYNGTRAPAFTTMYGLYDRHFSHAGDADWALPARWVSATGALDLSTPMNFASTADIIGGNSGSPVLDADLEVVGVVFDGNIESLPGDYIYLPELNRSVTVDVRAILEALDKVYDLDRLVLELTTGRLVPTEAEADRARR